MSVRLNIYHKLVAALVIGVLIMLLVDPWWVGAILVATLILVYIAVMVVAWAGSAPTEGDKQSGQGW